MFTDANIATVIVALAAIAINWQLVLPVLSGATKWYFVFMAAWAVPYCVGQITQDAQIGPIWVQYHLLDLAYPQWMTTVLVAGLAGGMWLLDWGHGQMLVMAFTRVSFVVTIAVGCVTEAWDTGVSLYNGISFVQAVDWWDWTSFALGGLMVSMPLLLIHRKPMGFQASMTPIPATA